MRKSTAMSLISSRRVSGCTPALAHCKAHARAPTQLIHHADVIRVIPLLHDLVVGDLLHAQTADFEGLVGGGSHARACMHALAPVVVIPSEFHPSQPAPHRWASAMLSVLSLTSQLRRAVCGLTCVRASDPVADHVLARLLSAHDLLRRHLHMKQQYHEGCFLAGRHTMSASTDGHSRPSLPQLDSLSAASSHESP